MYYKRDYAGRGLNNGVIIWIVNINKCKNMKILKTLVNALDKKTLQGDLT